MDHVERIMNFWFPHRWPPRAAYSAAWRSYARLEALPPGVGAVGAARPAALGAVDVEAVLRAADRRAVRDAEF